MNIPNQILQEELAFLAIKWFYIFELDLWLQGYIGDRKPWL